MSNKASLYKYTKKNSYFMGYYNPIKIPFDNTDYFLKISPIYNNKPGKLAYDLYGDERLGWIFSYFNRDKIQDPIFDLKSDMIIRVPTAGKVSKYI